MFTYIDESIILVYYTTTYRKDYPNCQATLSSQAGAAGPEPEQDKKAGEQPQLLSPAQESQHIQQQVGESKLIAPNLSF